MKKLVIVLAVLFTGFILKAQTVSIGPTAGFGHSWISNSSGNAKFNPMWNAGLSLNYSTKSHFGLGADIKYSAEGAKSTYATPGPADGLVNVTEVINANYIRVPLKLIYFFGKHGSAVRPKIYIGPNFGFLEGGKAVENVDGSVTKYNVSEDIKSFDFGVNAAAGLNFRLASKTWLNADLVYYQGLTDISKDNSTKSHNANVGINLGVLVGLGK